MATSSNPSWDNGIGGATSQSAPPEVYHAYGNIFDFYCTVNLERNEARVWREGFVSDYMDLIDDEDYGMLVERDFDPTKYYLIRVGDRFYLRNADNEQDEQEITRREARDLLAKAVLEDLGKDFYFDGREDEDMTIIDFDEGSIYVKESPQIIDIFDDENRFYLDPPYNNEWLEKREDGYYLCGKYDKECERIRNPKGLIADALLSKLWRKEIFKFPDRE